MCGFIFLMKKELSVEYFEMDDACVIFYPNAS